MGNNVVSAIPQVLWCLARVSASIYNHFSTNFI